MKTCTRTLFLVLLISFLFNGSINAAYNVWDPDDGVQVRQGKHIYWSSSGVVTQPDNSWGVVWSDAREDVQNIYMQTCNPENSPQWIQDGIQITNENWAQNDPFLMALPDNEWLVAWRDYRNGTSEDNPGNIYMQRISSDGSLLWDATGVSPFNDEDNPQEFYMIPANDCAAIIVWSGWGDAWAQKINYDGSLMFEDDIFLCEGHLENVVSDYMNGIIFSYYEDNGYNLYINKMSFTGELDWGEDNAGIQAFDPGQGVNLNSSLAVDENCGAYLVWSTTDEEYSDIYGQHYNSDGSAIWPGDYSVLISGDNFQHFQEIVTTSENSFAMIWLDGESWSDSDEIHIQNILSTANGPEYLWDGDEEGILLYEGIMDQYYPRTIKYTSDNSILINSYHSDSVGEACNQHTCKISDQGEILWKVTPEFDESYSYQIFMEDPMAASILSENSIVYIWNDWFPAQCHLQYQNFEVSEGILNETGDPGIITEGFTGDIEEPRVVKTGSDVYVSWFDKRFINQGELPYMQKISFEDGSSQWSENGMCIVPGLIPEPDEDLRLNCYKLMIIPDNSGGVIASWHFSSRDAAMEEEEFICLQRISPDGELLWGDSGLQLIEANPGYTVQSILGMQTCSDGDISIIGIIRNETNDNYAIWTQKLTPEGQPSLSDPDGIIVMETEAYYKVQNIRLLDDDSALIFYSESINANSYGCYATKISLEGELLWDTPLLLEQIDSDYNMGPSVLLADAGDLLMFMIYTQEPFYYDKLIYMNGITAEGELVWDENLEWGDDDVRWRINFAARDDNSVWVLFEQSQYFEVFAIDNTGEYVFADPIEIGNAPGINYSAKMRSDENGGVFVIWSGGESWFDTNYRFVHLTNEGEFATQWYTSEGLILVDGLYQQQDLCTTSDDEGGLISVWNDFRGRRGAVPSDDVYAMRTNDILVNVENNRYIIPETYSLLPAYPNPFNPSTTIGFVVPERALVKLSVFDILGRRVSVLMNESISAGKHFVIWNANGQNNMPVASGSYFIQLEANEYRQTQKIVLIK